MLVWTIEAIGSTVLILLFWSFDEKKDISKPHKNQVFCQKSNASSQFNNITVTNWFLFAAQNEEEPTTR